MHYPPETASIMLIARMIATVKQVFLFKISINFRKYLEFEIIIIILKLFTYSVSGIG